VNDVGPKVVVFWDNSCSNPVFPSPISFSALNDQGMIDMICGNFGTGSYHYLNGNLSCIPIHCS